jgi:hypothetical protein
MTFPLPRSVRVEGIASEGAPAAFIVWDASFPPATSKSQPVSFPELWRVPVSELAVNKRVQGSERYLMGVYFRNGYPDFRSAGKPLLQYT